MKQCAKCGQVVTSERLVRLQLYRAAVETVRAWDADDDAYDDLENAIEWLREVATAAGKLRPEVLP